MVKRKFKLMGKILQIVGISIVIITHIALLSMTIPQELLGGHAVINLIASGLIISGIYLRSKK